MTILVKILKRIPIQYILFGIILLLTLCAYIINMVGENAAATGESIVGDLGKAVGKIKALPELENIYSDAYAEGKKIALEGKDTTANLESSMKDLGNLEVLVAGIGVTNYHTVGEKYAALYLMKADVVFSVDMSNIQIGYKNEEKTILNVYVSYPKAEVYFDESQTEKIAEWQRNYFSGSAEDGHIAYLNSVSEVEKKVREEMAADTALAKRAEEAARRQIQFLIGNLCADANAVNVIFE